MTKRIKKRRYSTKLKFGKKVKIALLVVIVACVAYYAGASGINNEQINNIGEDEIIHEMKEYLSANETEGFDFSVRKDCDGNINGLNIKL